MSYIQPLPNTILCSTKFLWVLISKTKMLSVPFKHVFHKIAKINSQREKPSKNRPGIPVRTFPEFQVDAGRIPPEFRWNPPELLPALRRYSPGIPDISNRNSTGLLLAFRQYSNGIPAGIPPELLSAFRRYSTGIPAGIPPELLPAFRWYSTGTPAGIPPELLPAFRWYSTGILLELLPAFHRNSAGIIAGIPLVFRTTPAGIPLEFLTRILLEFHN